MTDIRLETGYICSSCADKLGGVWPCGHVATFHTGWCPQCGCRTGLASVDDWNWPPQSQRPKRGAGRD